MVTLTAFERTVAMFAELTEVQYPTYPTLADFEKVIDRVVAPGAYRHAFVEMFFDEMLNQRADYNMDGAIHAVAIKAALPFAEAYRAHVRFGSEPSNQRDVTFENVASFVSMRSFDDPAMQVLIDGIMVRRVDEVGLWIAERCKEFADAFEYDGKKKAIVIARTWLDYIDSLKGEAGYFRLVKPRRELAILRRSYELLVASVVVPKGR
jgi:hypothetical protein